MRLIRPPGRCCHNRIKIADPFRLKMTTPPPLLLPPLINYARMNQTGGRTAWKGKSSGPVWRFGHMIALVVSLKFIVIFDTRCGVFALSSTNAGKRGYCRWYRSQMFHCKAAFSCQIKPVFMREFTPFLKQTPTHLMTRIFERFWQVLHRGNTRRACSTNEEAGVCRKHGTNTNTREYKIKDRKT